MKRRIFSLLFVAIFIVTSLSGLLGGMVTKAADAKPTIWVVGDSTVSSFTDNYYYPRYAYILIVKHLFIAILLNH